MKITIIMTITKNLCNFSWFHVSYFLKNCPSVQCKNATDLVVVTTATTTITTTTTTTNTTTTIATTTTMVLSENKMSHSITFHVDVAGLLYFRAPFI